MAITFPTLPPVGYPGPPSTGVSGRKRALLQPATEVEVTKAGTVLENLVITGGLRVKAPFCTVLNVIVRTRKDGSATIKVDQGVDDVLLQDIEVDSTLLADGTKAKTGIDARGSDRVTLRRANVYGSSDGVVWGGVNFLAEDTWIHDLDRLGDDHSDCAQTFSGGVVNATWRRCALQAYNFATDFPHNTCMMFGTELSPGIKGLLLEDNYFDGGNVSLNMRTDVREVSSVTIRRNLFGPHSRYDKASVGLKRDGVTWDVASNLWVDTLTPVQAPA